jgi:hypothetical protein
VHALLFLVLFFLFSPIHTSLSRSLGVVVSGSPCAQCVRSRTLVPWALGSHLAIGASASFLLHPGYLWFLKRRRHQVHFFAAKNTNFWQQRARSSALVGCGSSFYCDWSLGLSILAFNFSWCCSRLHFLVSKNTFTVFYLTRWAIHNYVGSKFWFSEKSIVFLGSILQINVTFNV